MERAVKQLVKKLGRLLLGDYAAYYIYRQKDGKQPSASMPSSLTIKAVGESAFTQDPLMREQIGYLGNGSLAYACFDGDRIVAACFYWHGTRYRKRNFWPLRENEAKLVQIITQPQARGRGIASRLIASSSEDIARKGFSRAYARVWHSNTPSCRAFEKAGWERIALVFEINPLRIRPMRLRWSLGV